MLDIEGAVPLSSLVGVWDGSDLIGEKGSIDVTGLTGLCGLLKGP